MSLGALFNCYAFFNLFVIFGLLTEMLKHGAEANEVDEKLRDEFMAMKKKAVLMKSICKTKLICLKKDTIVIDDLGVKNGQIFAFSERQIKGLLPGQTIHAYKDEISGSLVNDISGYAPEEEAIERVENLVQYVDESIEQHIYAIENDQLAIFGMPMSYELIQSVWSTIFTGIFAVIQGQMEIE